VLAPAIKLPEKQATAWVTETTVDATRSWLNTLPGADSSVVARELYRSLYTLNRLELNPRTREKILELYRNTVNTVTASIQSHLGQQPLPLTPNSRLAAEIIRELNREMAIGYKTVVVGLYETWRQRLFRKSTALPIERALRYFGELLVHCYHVYMPYPPLVWLEVHELFRYAEQLRLENVPVEISVREGAGTTSIKERYSQICLLGLCNPYRLPQGEAKKVHSFLYQWAGIAGIYVPGTTESQSGNFYIDLLRDGPPIMSHQPVSAGMAKRIRVLDAVSLVEKVKSFIRRLEQGEPASQLALGTECLDSACLEMFRRVVHSWDEASLRQHNRSRGKGLVSVCIGVESAHFFADGQRPFLPPEEIVVSSEGPIDAALTESEEHSYIDFDLPIDTDAEKPESSDAAEKDNFHITRWQVVDQSASGMLLRSREAPGMHVRVGDILGIQFEVSADAVWWPAVVRRLQGDVNGIVEVGVELLASHYEPVTVRAVNGEAIFKPGLLLPPLKTAEHHRPQSLVFSRGAFRDPGGLQLSIIAGDKVRNVRPLKLVERSGSFEQVFFADVIEKES
jgi:hypothetical protein